MPLAQPDVRRDVVSERGESVRIERGVPAVTDAYNKDAHSS